jgi:hypothetical protein
MIAHYIQAVCGVLGDVLDLLTKLAFPLAVCFGLIVLAAALTIAFQKDKTMSRQGQWRRHTAGAFGYAAVGLLVVAGWAALQTTQPLARLDIQWRESAEATMNPVPDTSPVLQWGPAVAALEERTYTRTLTLPPEFLRRIGSQGVGVLSPYLTDPSAENVLRMVDTFRRSGRDVVFTRQMTRLDEVPFPLTSSQIQVNFQRLAGRAYDAAFEGRYVFRNATARLLTVRFLFNLPEAGTIRDISVTVGDRAITEPDESGAYVWMDKMSPGERREAVVRYHVIGARSWRYDLGSRRRRVQQFQLNADPAGPVRFLRGSLQPTASAGGALRWELASVVTAQQVALAFPPDTVEKQSYLQALSALPASFVLFLLGVLVVGGRRKRIPGPARLATALILFAVGLGAATVAAIYLGHVAGVILAPLAGALLAARVLGRHSLLASVPAALLPATFLSPEHSGLLVLILLALTLTAALLAERSQRDKKLL